MYTQNVHLEKILKMPSLCHQTKVLHHIKYRVIIYLQGKNRQSYEGTKIHSVLSTGTSNLALGHPEEGPFLSFTEHPASY